MSDLFGRILVVVSAGAVLGASGCVDSWDVPDSGKREQDASASLGAEDDEAERRDGQTEAAQSFDAGGMKDDKDAAPASGSDQMVDSCVGGEACGAASPADASTDVGLDCAACDPRATCTANTGVAVCTCPPDTEDRSGDGKLCVDKCELAECAADATCRLEGEDAKCVCKAGYSGDGRSCVPDILCGDLGCSEVASCETRDGRLQCVCPDGFQGAGVGVEGCTCAPDHTLDANGWCVHERVTNCRNTAPPHATAVVAPTMITYSDASGWSTPAPCAWSCDTDYSREDGACINTNTAQCVDRAPPNATSTKAEVTISYTSAGGWSTPAACTWTCLPKFVRTQETCTPAPCQLGSAEADAYVDPIQGVDDALHGAGAGGCAFRTVAYALLHARGSIYISSGRHAITQTLQVADGQDLICDSTGTATLAGQPAIQGGDVGFIIVFSRGGSLKNCTLQGEGKGICVRTSGAVTLDQNTISTCGGAAIHAGGDGLVVTGNTIDNKGTSVFFQAGGSATISGNTFGSTSEDVGCNQLTTIAGQGNAHSSGRPVNCRAECGCPAGF